MNTNKAKHTPGPLVADCYGAHTSDNYIEITVRAGDESPDCACQLKYSRLIAAAPELLAALENIAEMADNSGDRAILETARAAIAKAKGE